MCIHQIQICALIKQANYTIKNTYLKGDRDRPYFVREKNLIILGKNPDRIDCFCRFDLTQVNTINFFKE